MVDTALIPLLTYPGFMPKLSTHRIYDPGLAILCVALSHTLVALGGSDPTRRVSPLNPELWQTPQQLWSLFWIRLPYPMMYRAHL
jgi:hypothetical protein